MTARSLSTSLEVEATTSRLSDVRRFVSAFASEAGFSVKEVGEIVLAVDEAFTNIIRHAYTDTHGSIRMEIEVLNHRLTVSLFDTGTPFSPEISVRPNVSTMIKEKKKGGMGVFLIHKMMDKVEYIQHKTKNEVRMVKFQSS